MKHEEFVKALKNKGTISIKNLPELLKFRLDKNEEAMYEDECISLYIPIWFDCNKAFGLDVCSEENDDWINLYINWYPKVCDGERKLKMYISYCNNSTADEDFELDVVLAEDQYEAILRRFEAQFEEVYTSTIEESWKQFIIDSEVEDYGETEEE